jgi:class 3 adenylate cyclase/tetratricopeptide (TPR) repeat protein
VWVCAACGQENPDGFKFCGNCGAPLAVAAPAREVRKIVTILFCDLTGSTTLGDRTDPEALRATMRGYYEEMRTILERHGGTVEKFVGDAVMAVFGVPVSREDDALRAVRAAWEMRMAIGNLGLQARIGVNTGEVVAGEGDTLVTGDAVNVAARLEQAADAGEVLIGADTHSLVRDAVTAEPRQVAAKGKPDPVAAFRLVDVDLDAAAIARKLDTPLVGRTRELQQLHQAFERAVSENRCHLFTLLGPAGVGKSRLTSEFLSTVDATVLHGRCLDYGESITFWPVVSVLKQLGERAYATLEHIASGGQSQNELFWDVRAQLEEIASERPLVVLFDDIHWGAPTFLDLLDHIADLSRGAPILLLCLARPELLDLRPGWAGGKLNATTMLLEPLSVAECEELIDVHGGGMGTATRTRILAAADGNPLFVEEMVALARENDDVRVPSTVQALLQARLDQLGTDEREVIERGSVEGQVFHRGAVRELSPGSDVETQLDGLVRKELISPETTAFTGDHAFRFRHLLIRDAAYDSLPKETRAELHELFAGWLAANGQELIELDEVLGHHLEQAALYRRELGRADAAIERRAAERLAAAGSKAFTRDDLPAADNLLTRALQLLPAGDDLRAAVLLDRVLVLEQSGGLAGRSELIDELEAHPDPSMRLHGRIARLELRLFADPHGVVDEAGPLADEALEHFTEVADEFGLARAWYLRFSTEWLRSRAKPALIALEKTREHAERADARPLLNLSTIYMMGPLLHGPLSPNEVRARLEPLRESGGPVAMNTVLRVEASLLALEGRFDEALERHDRANEIVADLGLDVMMAVMTQWSAEVMIQQGRFDEAVEGMREGVRRLEALGDKSFRSTCLIRLADALYGAGNLDECEQRAIEGENLGAAEDVVNFAIGRSLRALVAADRGLHDEAEGLGRDALRFAYELDFPWVHAVTHERISRVHRAAGRKNEARAELELAIERFDSYGNTFDSLRTRALLVEL